MRLFLHAALVAGLSLPIQSNPPAQTPPRPRAASATVIVVRDRSGTPVQGVRVVVSGTANSEATTEDRKSVV